MQPIHKNDNGNTKAVQNNVQGCCIYVTLQGYIWGCTKGVEVLLPSGNHSIIKSGIIICTRGVQVTRILKGIVTGDIAEYNPYREYYTGGVQMY